MVGANSAEHLQQEPVMTRQDYDYDRRNNDVPPAKTPRADRADTRDPNTDYDRRTSSFWGWVIGLLVLIAIGWIVIEMVDRGTPATPDAQPAAGTVPADPQPTVTEPGPGYTRDAAPHPGGVIRPEPQHREPQHRDPCAMTSPAVPQPAAVDGTAPQGGGPTGQGY
jgi:hypothetical protein